jgi:hypothetical protein
MDIVVFMIEVFPPSPGLRTLLFSS